MNFDQDPISAKDFRKDEDLSFHLKCSLDAIQDAKRSLEELRFDLKRFSYHVKSLNEVSHA